MPRSGLAGRLRTGCDADLRHGPARWHKPLAAADIKARTATGARRAASPRSAACPKRLGSRLGEDREGASLTDRRRNLRVVDPGLRRRRGAGPGRALRGRHDDQLIRRGRARRAGTHFEVTCVARSAAPSAHAGRPFRCDPATHSPTRRAADVLVEPGWPGRTATWLAPKRSPGSASESRARITASITPAPSSSPRPACCPTNRHHALEHSVPSMPLSCSRNIAGRRGPHRHFHRHHRRYRHSLTCGAPGRRGARTAHRAQDFRKDEAGLSPTPPSVVFAFFLHSLISTGPGPPRRGASQTNCCWRAGGPRFDLVFASPQPTSVSSVGVELAGLQPLPSEWDVRTWVVLVGLPGDTDRSRQRAGPSAASLASRSCASNAADWNWSRCARAPFWQPTQGLLGGRRATTHHHHLDELQTHRARVRTWLPIACSCWTRRSTAAPA